MMTTDNKQWFDICNLDDILPSMGRCALFNNKQIAIFRVISANGDDELFAIDNYCPFSQSNTISTWINGQYH